MIAHCIPARWKVRSTCDFEFMKTIRPCVPTRTCLWPFLMLSQCVVLAGGTCLMPGDLALTRVRESGVTVLALRAIDGGTRIQLSNLPRNQLGTELEDASSGYFDVRWQVPDAGLARGDQVHVPFIMKNEQARLRWDDTLYLYTFVDNAVWYLYSLSLSREGYRWKSPPGLLDPDLTALVLPSLQSRPEAIDHVYDPSRHVAASSDQSRFDLLRQLSRADAWIDATSASVPVEDYAFQIGYSSGVISFLSPDYASTNDEHEVEVQVLRLYGNDGPAEVYYITEGSRSAYSIWEPVVLPVTDTITGLAAGGMHGVATTAEGVILATSDLQSWEPAYSSDRSLYDVTFYGGVFIAVGARGTMLRAASGFDDLLWSPIESGTQADLLAVASGPPGFMAAGSQGTRMLSTDGTNWTAVQGDHSVRYRAIAIGAEEAVFVGDAGAFAVLKEGRWTDGVIESLPELRAVAYADGMYAAVGLRGAVFTSSNGVRWEPQSAPFEESFYSVVYAGDQWIVGGGSGSIYATTEFADWELRLNRGNGYAVLRFLALTDRMLAGGVYGTLLDARDTTRLALSGLGFFVPQSDYLSWGDGDSCPQTFSIGLNLAMPTAFLRRNFKVKLFSRTPGLLLGTAETTVALLYRDGPGGVDDVAHGYGALLRVLDWNLTARDHDASNRRILSFRIQNTSPYESRGICVLFGESNTRPLKLAPLAAGTLTDPISIELKDTVRSLLLYEFLRDEEPVLHHRVFINNIYQETSGVAPVAGTSPFPEMHAIRTDPPTGGDRDIRTLSSSWGIIAPPPAGLPENDDFGLLLMGIQIDGAVAPIAGTHAHYSATGVFLDPATLRETKELIEADWRVGSTPEDLSINPWGELAIPRNIGLIYPRGADLEAVSSVGAPVDYQGNIVPVAGTLNLSVGESADGLSFSQWMLAAGHAGLPADADPDGDGLSLLLEYALGLHPNSHDASADGLVFANDQPDGHFAIRFSRPADRQGVQYRVMCSADLQNWTMLTAPPTLSVSVDGWEVWSVDPGAAPPVFCRLQLTLF
jgi:hypothetical protein